jgi:hypothetical protein
LGVWNSDTGAGDSPERSDGAQNAGDGNDFPIVTAQDQQNQIRVTYVPLAGRFLAVWNDLRAGEGWQVYGRLVNTEGGGHGPLKAFSPSGIERRTAPSIAHDPATGRSLVVWGTASGDVLGRLVDQAGDGVGVVVPLTSSAVWEGEPSAGFDPASGRYVVVWIEASSDFVLNAQALDREGRLIGSPIPITEAASGKLDLRMATDPDSGRHLVVWRDYRGVDIYSIRGRMLDPDGLPASEELVIADAEGSQISPEPAYDSAHRAFLVTWSDSRRTGTYELFGQVVASPDGMLIGSNVFISPSGGYPHAIGLDAGRSSYVVVYPKAGLRLFGRYVAPDGVAEGDEFAISGAESGQAFPHVALNPVGRGFLASWTDQREGAPHLFGRMVAPGVPGLDPAVAAPAECPGYRTPEGLCLDCEANAGPLVDAACPVGAVYTDHGYYLGCVTDRVDALRREGLIGGACKLALIAPRARSTVGR